MTGCKTRSMMRSLILTACLVFAAPNVASCLTEKEMRNFREAGVCSKDFKKRPMLTLDSCPHCKFEDKECNKTFLACVDKIHRYNLASLDWAKWVNYCRSREK
jgi:hypothetical protein